MAQESPLYDLMLMLDAAAPSERRQQVLGEVESILSGGTIVGKHDWGPRQLAYEIDHRTEADYHLFQFNGAPELIERLERMLKVTDGVLRYRVIKLRPGTPPPPAMRAERPARPEAAVAAAGGEESGAGEAGAEAPAAPAEAPAVAPEGATSEPAAEPETASAPAPAEG